MTETDMPPDIIVTIRDLPQLFCHKGARAFFATHGLDYAAFIQQGIPFSDFDGIDDDRIRLFREHVDAQTVASQGVDQRGGTP